jgi:pyridoxal phosphate enzyme (YggS family)
MTTETASFAAKLERLQKRIASATTRCDRKAEEITLIAVSKMFPAEAIRMAYAAGLRHFGESRVQEWEMKRAQLDGLTATWHCIGHLQSNKARRAVELFDRVDSVDAENVARRLDEAARAQGKKLQVLLEVNVGGEASKSGV